MGQFSLSLPRLEKERANSPGDDEVDGHGEEVVEGSDDGAGGDGWVDADAGEKEGGKDAEEGAGEAAADEADRDNGGDGDGGGGAEDAAAIRRRASTRLFTVARRPQLRETGSLAASGA